MSRNLFELAEIEILREGREPTKALILDYAIKIRKWLDKHSQVVANRIMQGDEVYQYSNKIKTYARV